MRGRSLFKTLTILIFLPALAFAVQEQDPPEPEPTLMERIEHLTSADETRGAAERFADLLELYQRQTFETFPERATLLGENVAQDRWRDVSPAGLRRFDRDTETVLTVLDAIERGELEAAAQLDYDLLHAYLQDLVDGRAYRDEFLLLSHVDGPQFSLVEVLDQMPRRAAGDRELILTRLEALPRYLDQVLVILRRGHAQGVTPPRIALREVPRQLLSLMPEASFESPLLAAFADLPDDDPGRRRADALYRAKIRPALEKLHRYITVTYLPGARATIAMRDLPKGEAWYAHRVKRSTTTAATPAEIHRIGLAEVERLAAEIDAVVREIGFSGDLEAFADLVGTHPDFYYDAAEPMLADYRDITKRADGEVLKLFSRVPRLPYGVAAMPLYVRALGAGAYDRGSLAAGRAAYFHVNTHALESRPKWRMEALALHQTVPGRHLQTALAQESRDLPWFRRLGGHAAFSEGWALYAEHLGYEMGFYSDPYQRYGQLSNQMWGALALVVDTGIHAMGWSRQRAQDLMQRHSGRAEHEIRDEIDRVIAIPGRALAPKIGELRIRAIRSRAEEALGARFEPRAFHDTLLGIGTLPLGVLEQQMEAWVASQL